MFLFLTLFFIPALSHASPTCSPACASNEQCYSAGFVGSTEMGYCQVNYNGGGGGTTGTGGTGTGGTGGTTGGTTSGTGGATNSGAVASQAACVPGTQFNTGIYNNSGPGTQTVMCKNNYGNYVNVCVGNETVGPCAPARIDPNAAATTAASLGSGCKALKNNLLQPDVNTGLTYFYSTVCPGDASYSSAVSGTGTGTNYGSNGNSSGQDAYASGVVNVVNNMIQSYKNILNSISNTSVNSNTNTNTGNTTTTTSTNTSSCSFLTADLRKGDSGDAVTQLTKTLVAEGLLSQPQDTFDDAVFQAVISYQEKYILAILTPVGLSRGTGFVGPSTRAFINNQCIMAQASSSATGTTTTTATTTTGTTGSTCSSSVWTKTNRFSYSFTKVGSSWNITLDNPALGTPSDFFYIPANASITASSASDLNTQAQGRYNTMIYFPGNATGNTFYQDVFGAFIAGYYDWNNQIAKATTCSTTATIGALSLACFSDI